MPADRLPWTPTTGPRSSCSFTLRGAAHNWLTTSTSGDVLQGFALSLGGFNDGSVYAGLFDQYRIKSIELSLVPDVVVNTGSASATTLFGDLTSCVDLDDNNTPSTYAGVAAHQGALESGGLATHYHKWSPTVVVPAVTGSGTANVVTLDAPWLNCSNTNVLHYGFKAGAKPSSGDTISYSLLYRAVVEFRNPL